MCRHCMVWVYRDGYLMLGCAHCDFLKARFKTGQPDSPGESVDNHRRLCPRASAPSRTGGSGARHRRPGGRRG